MVERKIFTLTPTLSTSIYASGDVMGSVLTLDKAVLNLKGAAKLESITVLDKAAQGSAFDLVFFDEAPAATIGADNAAYALADADLSKCLGHVSIATGDYQTAGANNQIATKRAIDLVLQAKSGSKNLYVALVCRGTPTYGAASDLSIKLGFEQG